MGGVAVFTAASAACGLAASPGWLIGFRAVQGLGAAMLMPQTLTIITNTFPPDRRGAAFRVWGAVAGVATIAGPTLGGLLVTVFDWRWIFFVNLPIGLFVLLVTPLIIPDVRPGGGTGSTSPGCCWPARRCWRSATAWSRGRRYDWGTIAGFVDIPLVLGLGVVLLIAFLLVQKLAQDKEPLVPFALFRDRNYSVVNWVSGVLAVGMMGIFIPLTIYLQSVLGFSALKAGLTMAPASLVSMFVAPVASGMTDKIGGKFILMSGLILFGAGMGWIALIAQPDSSWLVFLAPLIVAGLGMGCIFAPMVTVAMRDIEPRMAGAASGVLNTIRQVGLVIGTAHRCPAAEQARLRNGGPGGHPVGRAAAAGTRPVRGRHRQLREERHPGRGRPIRRQHPPGPEPARPDHRGNRPHQPRGVYLRLRDRHAADDGAADRPPWGRRVELPGDQARQACARARAGRQDRNRSTRLTVRLDGRPHCARRAACRVRGPRSH